MTDNLDALYKHPLQQIAGFRFDEPVAHVFKDMIQRSVPGYHLILSLLGVISAEYAQPDSYCYDLGCSLGASTLAMRHHINAANCRIIGIDNSPAMIERCKKNIATDTAKIPVEILQADILSCAFKPAAIVVLNFTLQFIPLPSRTALLQRIAQATRSGGVLLLSEKIKFTDTQEEQCITALHHQFKSLNGYSNLEIAQKREALENVLIPESLATHKTRLLDAGFSQVYTCLQCFNFISLLAIK